MKTKKNSKKSTTKAATNKKRKYKLDRRQLHYSTIKRNTPSVGKESALILSDIHIPYEDPGVVAAALECAEYEKPTHVFLNGDVLDCFAMSKFVKPIDAEASFDEELRRGRKFLRELRHIVPNSKIYYVEGNHEYRLRARIDEAGDSERWSWLPLVASIPQLLGMEELDIEWVSGPQGEGRIRWHNATIGHWKISRSKNGYTANGLLDRYGENMIQGHTHHAAIAHRRQGKHHMWAIENPCMCPINGVPYADRPRWQQGWTMLRAVDGVIHPELCVVEQPSRRVFCGGFAYDCGPGAACDIPIAQ